MYSVKLVTEIVDEYLDHKDCFLVDIKISNSNAMSIFIDSDKGVSIDECVSLSKFIEERLDREDEDYELEVSSAGIGYPFKVEKQYLKNIGRDVEVLFNAGEKLKGTLKAFGGDELELEYAKMVKPEGKKRKQLVTETATFKLETIKSTKVILSL